MAFSKAVVALLGLTFAAFGIAFLIAPANLMAHVHVAVQDATAAAEIRAVYGGMMFGYGLWLLLALRRSAWLGAALASATAVVGFTAAFRLASALFGAGSPAPPIYIFLAMEAVGAALGFAALRALAGREPQA